MLIEHVKNKEKISNEQKSIYYFNVVAFSFDNIVHFFIDIFLKKYFFAKSKRLSVHTNDVINQQKNL